MALRGFVLLSTLLFFSRALVACTGETGAPVAVSTAIPSVDRTVPPHGAPDRGDDPAVVAIGVGGQAACSGALVAPDVVLTARRCVVAMLPSACPAGGPQVVTSLAPESLRILVGDKVTSADERARGKEIATPSGDVLCGADIALVFLDTPIDEVQPLTVRATGAAKGDHVRTVSFDGSGGGRAADKLVRDHLPVIDVSKAELEIGEACDTGAGGPALDEATAEVVGVASRAPAQCADADARDIYTRADVFASFIGAALAIHGATGASAALATGARNGKEKTKKGAIDVGAGCLRADDCAAGVCVTQGSRAYCSRTCDSHDRCPPRFRCKKASGGGGQVGGGQGAQEGQVCVQ
jgi:Trypsin